MGAQDAPVSTTPVARNIVPVEGSKLATIHGDSGARYLRIHEKTVSCQRLLSSALNTQ